MSANVLVAYLKGSNFKKLIKDAAKQKHLSTSEYVCSILKKSLVEKTENPFLKFFGVGKDISQLDWDKVEQSQKDFRSTFKSNIGPF